tara:strand:- start:263 stop:607 length:345 start_codon:yes stop_codon:yes gene_type:complete
LNGYYSVFNPRGEKIADCGSQKDAINLIGMRNARWDGHYYMFNPLPGDIIDVSSAKQLPTRDIVVNMDGGVGGSWHEVPDEEFDKMFVELTDKKKQTKQLPEDCQEPFIPDFHD